MRSARNAESRFHLPRFGALISSRSSVRRAGSDSRPLAVIQRPNYVSYGSHERRKLIRRGTHLAQRCRGISRTSHQDIVRKSRLRLSALDRVRSACASFKYHATSFCGRHERHTEMASKYSSMICFRRANRWRPHIGRLWQIVRASGVRGAVCAVRSGNLVFLR